jgi:hypothetical protein
MGDWGSRPKKPSSSRGARGAWGSWGLKTKTNIFFSHFQPVMTTKKLKIKN